MVTDYGQGKTSIKCMITVHATITKALKIVHPKK